MTRVGRIDPRTWWAVAIIAAMALGFTWCVVEDQRAKRAQQDAPAITMASPATPAHSPAPAAPPPPPAVIAQTVELPARKLDAARVLGQDAARVARLLGRGTPGHPGMIYDGFDGVLVRVEFERRRAGLVLIQATGYRNTQVDRDAVLAWAGATEGMTWGIDRAGGTVEVWDPEVKKRSAERERVADAIGDYLSRVGVGSGHARGEVNTSFLVRTRGTACTTAGLRKLVSAARDELGADLSKLGFVEVTCDLDGPRITLR